MCGYDICLPSRNNMGSSPIGITNILVKKYIGVYISWLDSKPDKFEVVGSSPTTPTKYFKCLLYESKFLFKWRFHL